MPSPDAFDILRSALEAVGIRYAVGGSWASTAFGEPRFTNDVDILADVTPQNLELFLSHLPDSFYADAEEARNALRSGRHTPRLDRRYLERAASELGISSLLHRSLGESSP